MTKIAAFAALAAAAFAAPVAAQSVSPAERQLAQSLGVEAGVYSLSQLTRLQGLDDATNGSLRAFIIDNPAGSADVQRGLTTFGNDATVRPSAQDGFADDD